MKKPMNFDFVGHRKVFFTIAIALVVIGIVANLILGTQLDIEFRGGTMISYTFDDGITSEDAAATVENAINQEVSIEISEDRASGKQKLIVNLASQTELSPEDQDKITSALTDTYTDSGVTYLEANSVNPTMGQEFFLKCLAAMALAGVFLIIYIGIRFRKVGGISAGLMAIVALVFDILIAYFVFVIFRIPLDNNFIAVALTLLGYALNDAVVIYDRIRENRRLMGPKVPIREVVNKSMNQCFARSLNTSLSTFVAIGTVAVVALVYGLDEIVSFALPMMIGIAAAFCSTQGLANPLWVTWQEHKAKKKAEATPAAK